jgi:hypothetical protein
MQALARAFLIEVFTALNAFRSLFFFCFGLGNSVKTPQGEGRGTVRPFGQRRVQWYGRPFSKRHHCAKVKG